MERQSSIIFIQSKIWAANTPERIKKSISIFVTTQQMKIQNGTRMTTDRTDFYGFKYYLIIFNPLLAEQLLY